MSIRMGWAILALGLVLPAAAEEPGRMQGHILGLQCAEQGRIGECYLKWADKVVFRSMAGDIYSIDLAASGIKQEGLDEAYGLEVELYGKVLRDGQGARVGISQLNIVKPPGSKEFFKG